MSPDALEAIDLRDDFLLLRGHLARRERGGDEFWSALAGGGELTAKVDTSWLVGEYACDDSWEDWERHPQGDEVVRVLEGEIVMIFERDGRVSTTLMGEGDTVVVPIGTWHTVDVRVSARLLNITWGKGTDHRAR